MLEEITRRKGTQKPGKPCVSEHIHRRVGQNHIYTAYIRYFRWENQQIYGLCIQFWPTLHTHTHIQIHVYVCILAAGRFINNANPVQGAPQDPHLLNLNLNTIQTHARKHTHIHSHTHLMAFILFMHGCLPWNTPLAWCLLHMTSCCFHFVTLCVCVCMCVYVCVSVCVGVRVCIC
jgi:hypothetical protein